MKIITESNDCSTNPEHNKTAQAVKRIQRFREVKLEVDPTPIEIPFEHAIHSVEKGAFFLSLIGPPVILEKYLQSPCSIVKNLSCINLKCKLAKYCVRHSVKDASRLPAALFGIVTLSFFTEILGTILVTKSLGWREPPLTFKQCMQIDEDEKILRAADSNHSRKEEHEEALKRGKELLSKQRTIYLKNMACMALRVVQVCAEAAIVELAATIPKKIGKTFELMACDNAEQSVFFPEPSSDFTAADEMNRLSNVFIVVTSIPLVFNAIKTASLILKNLFHDEEKGSR